MVMHKESLRAETATNVLIFTAAIGGGHEALARSIRADLERARHNVILLDGLRELSPVMAWAVKWGYLFQLRFAPMTIGPLFRIKTQPWIAARLRSCYGILYGWRLMRSIRRNHPDVIVSTYPVITSILDWLRRTGRLTIPVVTVIADYGVHALWIGPSTESHLVSSQPSQALVFDAGGRATIVRMPISAAFSEIANKIDARRTLGLPLDRHIVLVAGGAWGVGDLEPAVRAVLEAGAFPVMVTGNNRSFKQHLERNFPDPDLVRIIGWTSEMPLLMAASDCLIQNAGGMTCHEAAEAKLPVIFFRPIPGHGAMNARVMVEAGATIAAASEQALVDLLQPVVAGRSTLAAPPPRPGVSVVAAILSTARLGARPSPPPEPKALAIGRRVAVLTSMLALLFWFTVTPWSGVIGSVLMPREISASDLPAGSVAIVVRTNDPDVARLMETVIAGEQLPVALFVGGRGAAGLDQLTGVTVGFTTGASGAILRHPQREWQHERRASAIARQLGEDANMYVLVPKGGRSLLSSIMMPDGAEHLYSILAGSHDGSTGIVILETKGLTAQEAVDELHRELEQIQEEGLQCVPLSSLH